MAFGLRNPWKTVEYKNYLFVPDIGKAKEEELNIVDLSNSTLDKNLIFFDGHIMKVLGIILLNLTKSYYTLITLQVILTITLVKIL